MVRMNRAPARGEERDKSNIKDYEQELDVIIEKLAGRVRWYLSKLEIMEDDLAGSNRTSDALNKLASLLVKFMEFKGYRFDDAGEREHIFDLLEKLKDPAVRKRVEEVLKHA